METHKLVIKHTNDSFKLLLDDFEIKGITNYKLKCAEGEEISKLTLTLVVMSKEVEI